MALNRTIAAAIAALVCVSAPVSAQGTDPDIIRGRVVTPDSQPVPNAAVKITGTQSQSVRQTRSDARGNFQMLMSTGEGDYLLEVTAVGFVPVQVRLQRQGDVEVLRANVVMRKTAQALDAARIVEQRRPPREGAFTSDVSSSDRFMTGNLPADVQGDLLKMAATIPGVALVLNPDGSIAGVSALGLSPQQNSTRLNGLPINNSSIPRDASAAPRIATTTYDPARGGFSGAQISVSSGGDQFLSQFISHSVRFTLDDPSMQVTDRAAQSLRPEYRNLIASGRSSGPIVRDTMNYNLSWQLSRRTSPMNSVLDADAEGLARLGISGDSVTRLRSVFNQIGVPARFSPAGADRRTTSGSIFGQFDYNRNSQAQFSTTLNASYNDNANGAVSSRSLPSFGGEQKSWNLTAQERASTYLGSAFLNDLAVGIDLQHSAASPYLGLPQGSVLVSSPSADGGVSTSTVSFGSASGLRSSSNSGSASFLDQLSWFVGDNRHRVKATFEGSYAWTHATQNANTDGTFTYLSIADLEAGKPSSFSRRLNAPVADATGVTSGFSIGDTFRKSNRLQFQYGVRVDGATFPTKPAYNAALDQVLGVRTDHVPNDVGFSPRFGFSWTVGQPPPAIAGIIFGPGAGRATIRGGFGRFWGMPTPVANTMLAPLDQTGLPSGAQTISCIGSAVPAFNWNDALARGTSAPNSCADGSSGSQFAIVQPRVQLFDPAFHAPSAWRGNLEVTGFLASAIRGSVNLQVSENTHLGAFVDRNFSGAPRFTLGSEGNRPVYATSGGIVPATGQVALADSRIAQSFAQVMANRGDGRSRSMQLTVNVVPVITVLCSTFCFNVNTTYSTIRVRDAVRGFGGSTDGDPRAFGWARSTGDVRHQFQFTAFLGDRRFGNGSITGTLRSGVPYTPIVLGDVNGDGSSGNDRAFIFPGTAADTGVAGAMSALLANASPSVRNCLRANLGRVAERNSCEGPWIATMNASFALEPGLWGLPPRLRVSMNFVNPLAGIDALVHRGGETAGWGQSPAPDPVLLTVRGFDPATNRFTYEVNQRFGETRGPRSIPTSPFQAQIDLRWSLGPDFNNQNMQNMIRRLKRPGAPPLTEQAIRTSFAQGFVGVFQSVLSRKDSLKFTAEQVAAITAVQKEFAATTDSAYAAAARRVLATRGDPDDPESHRLMVDASIRVQSAVIEAGYRVIDLLNAEQLRRMQTTFILNRDYLDGMRKTIDRMRIPQYPF